MATDTYFYKRTIDAHNPNEPIGVDEYGEYEYDEMDEIAYIQGSLFLLRYLHYEEKSKEVESHGDFCFVPVTREEMENLEDECNRIIEAYPDLQLRSDNGEDNIKLPWEATDGLFCELPPICGYTFNEVVEIRDTFENILSELKSNEEVFMDSWE